jgi:hypothetical protein
MTPEGRDSERVAPLSLLRRWPPVLWLLVYVGSIFILNGSNGQRDPLELALGIALAAIACVVALYLAIGPWPGRPRPRGTGLLIGGVIASYGICALAAAVFRRSRRGDRHAARGDHPDDRRCALGCHHALLAAATAINLKRLLKADDAAAGGRTGDLTSPAATIPALIALLTTTLDEIGRLTATDSSTGS